ncbi:xylose ABC transporter ATP-binding protein [Lichenicoccus roseus]|uniref:Xylose ABC transporter ATP-binding protein n=1 Tax=Lichenicoccus roseus TaxID=2683649 RepID=A0A5R9JA57_9PROT|nr:xylose ABC transporter ATP-binding protein [Lichenicoccus roseus]TLU73693.1 xylose ABC transporter ATP-binding protein [Lichenicoccus roseus]
MSEYLLEMRGIIKEFSGVRALNGIDLAVKPGECVGLCGENGAGKSTMMKVLSAVYPYGTWQGEILWDGQPLQASGVRATEDAGIVIIHQELMLVPQLSVAENIFLGREPKTRSGLIDFDAMFARATAMLNDLRMPHINAAKPVSNYGGGEQQLIEIAKALSKNARLLILDEPTSSLTRREIDVLLDLVRDLKRRGTACVYISHKLDEIEAIADSVTVIRDGAFVGSAPMAELKQSDIIRMMVGREMNNLFPREEHEIGEVVFEARNFTVWDPENRQRKRVDDISFSVRRGEILGIAGLVGAGRTELVSAIFGAWRGTSEGSVILDGKPLRIRSPSDAVRAGICMVPEDRKAHGIVPDMGVGQNMTMAVLNSFAPGGLINEAAEMNAIGRDIARMRIKTASPILPISNLSGGNQQKAVIAKMLAPAPKVLILDEPTRGVDVGAKYEIYKLIFALARTGTAVIMVSSEMPEVLGISDRVLVIGEGELRGNFANQGLTQEQVLSAAILPAHKHAAE